MYSKELRMRAIELYIKYEKSPGDVIRELGYPDRKMLCKWYKMYLEKQESGVPYEKGMRRSPASRRKSIRRQSVITSSTGRNF